MSEEEQFTLSSRKKWFWLGITIALLNPILCGLVLGISLWTEPSFKREAKIILGLSISWGVALIYLSNWLISSGYLPYR